jgi:hypothetical protein
LYFSKNGEGIYYLRQKTSKGSKKSSLRTKNRCPDKQDSGLNYLIWTWSTTAAGRTAGAWLHARKHKTLPFLKIDRGTLQHIACTLFQEQLQALQL